ncbi:hypothetical protein ACQPZX_13145 [Actinoplanes sp. CA-142083]|uniref:hypothetical protein n=1 Tax=Actinoplanes sp. CA-142083 TaxID=3239903 RepID=UPI003D93C2C5
MPDLRFIARVTAVLLTTGGAAPRSWSGRRRLQAVVQARLGGDRKAAALLAAAGERPRPDLAAALAAQIRRVAEADPRFAVALRQLVVDAYAEPGVADGLPDPAPLVE